MRSIQSVFDVDLNRHMSADEFFSGGSWRVHALRRKETDRFQSKSVAYRCSWCGGAVVARKGGFHGTDHFAHREDGTRSCPWHTTNGRKPDFVNLEKFNGRQESELHDHLKRFIENALSNDPKFCDVRVEKSAVPGDRQSTQPDVFAIYHDRKIAFELQLSTTQVPIIDKRERYNRAQGIFTIWIFHDFVKFREMATSKDIYVANFFNAFELDGDAIAASKNTGVLHFKVWWLVPDPNLGRDEQTWHSDLVSIHDLKWHDGARKAYAFEYFVYEAMGLRARHFDFIDKFETFWLQRDRRNEVLNYKAKQKAVLRFAEVLGELWSFSLDEVEEWKFFELLDRLFEVREGKVLFGSQNIKGRVDTVLENWPWFTDALEAIVKAYEFVEILEWDTYQRKVLGNRLQASMGVQRFQPIHAFNPALRVLFPGAGMNLHKDF